VLGAYLGFLWCFTRVLIRAPSGRQRFNVLGALNAITHELITVTNESYINSVSVVELLEKIAKLGIKGPITLIMDNARYQRCNYVSTQAEHLGIEILFLPSYSPNLNLIERLWKFVKKECLYSTYYDNFQAFKQAITACLSETTGRHKSALDTLLTLKFQTFQTSISDL
jgi:transposase